MIVLDMGFLVRSVRIAEEDKGFSFSVGRVLKSKDVAEFAAIVGEQSRENIAEWETIRSQICFEGLNFFACLSGGLIVQQDAEHEINMNELEGHDNLAARSTDERIHFDTVYARMVLHKAEEIIV